METSPRFVESFQQNGSETQINAYFDASLLSFQIFTRTTKSGLPYVALIVASLFSFLAYMGIGTGSGQVFGWLVSLVFLPRRPLPRRSLFVQLTTHPTL